MRGLFLAGQLRPLLIHLSLSLFHLTHTHSSSISLSHLGNDVKLCDKCDNIDKSTHLVVHFGSISFPSLERFALIHICIPRELERKKRRETIFIAMLTVRPPNNYIIRIMGPNICTRLYYYGYTESMPLCALASMSKWQKSLGGKWFCRIMASLLFFSFRFVYIWSAIRV